MNKKWFLFAREQDDTSQRQPRGAGEDGNEGHGDDSGEFEF